MIDRHQQPVERVKYGLPYLLLHSKTLPTLPTLPLLCHPGSDCSALRTITVSARFTGDGTLLLNYRLSGEIAGIRLPAEQPSTAADNLWQHTCCEAFVAPGDAREYREFNFSPSGLWAAYRFNDYRQRDNDFTPTATPRLSQLRHAAGFELDAALPPALLPEGDTLSLGLSAVIEATDGSKTYWALAHAAAQADFHLRQSFTLTLKRNTP